MSLPASPPPGDAAHVGDACALEREIEQLHHAIETRSVIGRAQGIVMARLEVDADQAIAYLKRVSMQTNRKVVDIATEVAATRRLPNGA